MNNMTIKTEPDIKSEPIDMKLEEDDEGLYEETGDLDMTLASTGVWLVKVPNWLMERWNEIDDDEEIQIGTIRVRTAGGGEDATKLRLSLTDAPANEGLPKDFDMNVTNMAVENTFIFTEKDLPGFETKPKPDGPEIPARLIYQQRREREAAAKKANPDGRFQPYARKSIPSTSSLLCCHELRPCWVYVCAVCRASSDAVLNAFCFLVLKCFHPLSHHVPSYHRVS
jgi:transcription initiation factor TFIIF subunit beta